MGTEGTLADGPGAPIESVLTMVPWPGWVDAMTVASDTLCDPLPWKRPEVREAALEAADPSERVSVQAFLLGEAVDEAALAVSLGSQPVQPLLKAGLLIPTPSGRVTSAYMLVSAFGLVLFASWRAADIGKGGWDPWIGADSITLGRLVQTRRPDSTLDLGCGTGILGLCSARNGSEVVAVDITATCVEMTRHNAWMNRLGDRVVAIHGDLATVDFDRRFDLVVSNPPFFPAPPGSLHVTAAEGGADGLDVLRQVVQRLPEALAVDGEALIISAGYGDGTGPSVRAELEQMCAELKLSANMLLLKPLPARWTVFAAGNYARSMGVPSVSSNVAAIIRSLHATFYHPFVLVVTRSSPGRRPLTCTRPHGSIP